MLFLREPSRSSANALALHLPAEGVSGQQGAGLSWSQGKQLVACPRIALLGPHTPWQAVAGDGYSSAF